MKIQDESSSIQRLIAVDWSGRADIRGVRKHLWIADLRHGIVALSNGYTREEAVEYLIQAGLSTDSIVVGLDFAFSFPAWFVSDHRAATMADFWDKVGDVGEEWLRKCEPPFWGKPRCPRPPGHQGSSGKGLRRTEQRLKDRRLQPKSTFQIGGAGAVGTGSIRGMPYLVGLKQEGFQIWPFDQPMGKVVVEIYPRLFTGSVNVSSASGRDAHLHSPRFASLDEQLLAKARSSEDAFDALCSVIGMEDHAQELANLQQAADLDARLEGEIWEPTLKMKRH